MGGSFWTNRGKKKYVKWGKLIERNHLQDIRINAKYYSLFLKLSKFRATD
jgi:hypothetical protein